MYLGRMSALEGSFGVPLDWPSGLADKGFLILLCANRLNVLFLSLQYINSGSNLICALILFQFNCNFLIASLRCCLSRDRCLFTGNCRVCNWPGSNGENLYKALSSIITSSFFNV